LPAKAKRRKELEEQMGQASFWDNPDGAKSVVTEMKALKALIDPLEALLRDIGDVRALRELGEEAGDAASLEEADRLIVVAARKGRILQVGHVERFNPAVVAAQKIVLRPMFFEVHRLGIFTPRSLDIDVVYDVMIHDLDILLSLVNAPIVDLKAVGIPVITEKVDIAQARVEFETGTVANVTASRVSTERVRKMRFFQEHEYISLDFGRQDALRIRVQPPATPGSAQPGIGFEKLETPLEEPLRAELRAFLDSVRTRKPAVVDGAAGRRALALADRVTAGILEHAQRVQLGAFSPQGVQ